MTISCSFVSYQNITPNMFLCLSLFFFFFLSKSKRKILRVEWQAVVARQSGSHRKFIFSQMVAAFSMLSSWLGVSRKAPLVRKSFSLTSESLSPWSCQSAEPRRPSWFRRNIELLFDVDMSLSHCALPPCSGCDIFYSQSSYQSTENSGWSHGLPLVWGNGSICIFTYV